MSQILDLQQTELRYGREIHRFQSLCSHHGIAFGTVDALFAFSWLISKDEALYSAVTAFVLELQQRKVFQRPFSDILSILLLGVAGESIKRPNAEVDSATSLLTSFLSSLGGWSPADQQQALDMEDEIRAQLSESPFSQHEASSPVRATPPSPAPELPGASSADAQDLVALINHLEHMNLELRQKLEAIDERVRLMEPAASSSPVDVPSPTAGARFEHPPQPRTQYEASGMRFEAVMSREQLSGSDPYGQSFGDVAVAEPPPEKSSHVKESNFQAADTPLQAEAESAPYSSASEAAVEPLLGLLRGTPLPAARGRKPGKPVPSVASATEVPHSSGSAPPAQPRNPFEALAAPAADPGAASPQQHPHAPRLRHLTNADHMADQKRMSAPLRRRRRIQAAIFGGALALTVGTVLYNSTRHQANPEPSSAPVASDSLSHTAPGLVSPEPAPSDVPFEPPASNRLTIYSAAQENPGSSSAVRLRASKSAKATPTSGISAKRTGEPMSVSSSIMAQHLVSSKPPNYPRMAAVTRLQGVVVLKAIIAKDGTVENVKALGGHHLLRGAAASAVRNWRYRPYLLNGQPVEVATLVTIDFALTK